MRVEQGNSTGSESGSGMGQIAPAYAVLLAAQILPFVCRNVAGDIAYFLTTATATVFIGAKRAMWEQVAERISQRAAALAPMIASSYLFGLYLLLKYSQIDINTIMAAFSTLLGAICLSESMQPVMHTLIPEPFRSFALWKKDDASSQEGFYGFQAASWLLGLSTAAAYALHVEPNFLLNNILAWGIAARTISLIQPSSFLVAAGLLTGLFLYDVFWVFGTDVMVTVAMAIDAPAKFLFPRDLSSYADPSSVYPYAVLGLGDIVVPSLFASLALTIDKRIVYQTSPSAIGHVPSGPYFRASFIAYFVGLGLTFVANTLTSHAQPALFYLVPSLLGSSLLTAAMRGEMKSIVAFQNDVVTEGNDNGDSDNDKGDSVS
uniref:Minor histocompatibility antigen H13 n=1 Tax=Compsopogon caeruleus TaxID=31354 RepID=A0A7S1XEF9_9RHOD